MTINVVFEDFEEMQAFASKLLGGDKAQPVSKAAETQPAPVGQQAKPAPAIQPVPAAVPVPSAQPVPVVPPAPAVQPVPVAVPVPAVQPAPVAAPQQPVPTAAPTYSLDDLARAAMTLMDAGRQAELQQLLARFGVEALPMLPQAHYGAFATELRGLGAQI